MHIFNGMMGPGLPPPPRHAPAPTFEKPGGLAPWQTKRIATYIDANLENSLLTSEMAAVTRLSVSHFGRAFRVSFGQAPHAYLIARRVQRAKYLMLAEEPMSLAEIALTCGLSDQAHLSRLFRKVVGESPAAWRRKRWSPRTIHRSAAPSTPMVAYP